MEKILTIEEMKNCDIDTCNEKNLTTLELIEIAGNAIYEYFIRYCNPSKKESITVIAGLGNNGSDGLIVALRLKEKNYNVNVIVLGSKDQLSNESLAIVRNITSIKNNIIFFNTIESIKNILSSSDYIIDGIFGTGLNREVSSPHLDVINLINQSDAYTVSIDIPSGVFGNNGKMSNVAIEADLTLVIQNLKIGNLLNDAKDYHGEIRILDIGLSQNITSQRYFLTVDEIHIPNRKHNTHKYQYGSVLTIGGSFGMMGAPLLSALASMRTGSGLVTIAFNKKHLNSYSHVYPEIMISSYQNIMDINKNLVKKNVVVFGPGLGRNDSFNYEILRRLLESGLPIVVDADGIYYLKGIMNEIEDGSKIVITPHLGEMSMLLEVEKDRIEKNPLFYIDQLTNKGFTVVLKGPCTISANNQQMVFCNIGNPGMATAGSGDVLSGMIASFIGQGKELLDACTYGVFIHSLAGNLARDDFGEYSMMATDIIKKIPRAIKRLK